MPGIHAAGSEGVPSLPETRAFRAPTGELTGLILPATCPPSPCSVLSQNQIWWFAPWHPRGFTPARWPLPQCRRDCSCLARGNHSASQWLNMGPDQGLALKWLPDFLRAKLMCTPEVPSRSIRFLLVVVHCPEMVLIMWLC